MVSRINSSKFREALGSEAIYSSKAIGLFLPIISDELDRVREQMTANTVRCQLSRIGGLSRISSTQILSPIGLIEGMELTKEQVNDLMSQLRLYPWVESFTVKREMLPQRLIVEVKEAQPWLVVEYDNRSWLVSTKGELLEPLTALENSELIKEAGMLPRLYGIEPPLDEQTYLSSINERLKYASRVLEFIDLAGGLPFSFSSIQLLPLGVLMVEPESSKPVQKVFFKVHTLDEARTMLQRLGQILNDIQSKGEEAREIDLRFAGQGVVR